MGGTLETFGLRPLREGEAALFASWEAAERPYPWSTNSFPAHTLVYETVEGVRGFAVVKIVESEAYLENMMIAPTIRRKGAGVEMLQKVMMWAASAGAEQVLLDVDTMNLPAIGLYIKLGFEFLEQRENSYPRGEDAYIMRREL
jgi:[ribosomal protein S18]-alanine N-acetyltransferase